MTVLLFTLEPNCLHIQEKEQQTLLSEQILPFSDFEFPKTAQILTTQIKELYPTVEGAIFNTITPEFYLVNKQVSLLNESLENFTKQFSELLNIPILLASEQSQETDLITVLKEKADYLAWNLDYFGYTPGKEEYSVESLLTIGNGFMGLRGTTPEMTLSNDHYPATYIAGLYNEESSEIAGQIVENEDFVNSPNNQSIHIKVSGTDEWLNLKNSILHYLHRNLDLKTGLFTSHMIIEDSYRHQLKITAHKIVNMAKMNNYSIKYSIQPLNFSKEITVKATTDGSVYNFNVERYRNLTAKHFHITQLLAEKNNTVIEIETTQSKIKVQQISTMIGDFFDPAAIKNTIQKEKIEQTLTFSAEKNNLYTLEKHIQVTASIAEQSWGNPSLPATSFDLEFAESKRAWESLWKKSDIQLTGDMMSQKLLRIHTYHLLVSASPFNNNELDVSVTARGLHGEAYRGHIFWDEIFILPFYILHFPETAKQLLMYRYNRLDKAKENARESGYEGAMYPWQSGLDGSEDTQKLHLNPLNGEWGEDHSILQRHVSLAIAYNIWMYWNNSGDDLFIKEYGAEMLLEIANFWRSAATFDETTNRYYIDKVMGPDEFHEAYPDSTESGLKNNAYTNLMVVWLFEELETILSLLNTQEQAKLFNKTEITAENLEKMNDIRKHLSIEVNEDGIIAQYEGYFDLKEIDWEQAKEQYGNIYRMDRILKAEGQSPDDYKVSKQADTLMLFYNLNKEKIDEILEELGYDLPTDYLEKNLLYYLNRTSHGSTLSRIVHAQLAEEVAFHDLSWKLYQEALYSDYQDIQGGTTAEGIHTGVMAATIYVTLTTYAGIDIKKNYLTIKPNLPKNWSDITFNFDHKGIHYSVTVSKNSVQICPSKKTTVIVKDQSYQLTADENTIITY
ncbi:glycoside hydrolase family 65 protein [Enterococcus caccae]|uniref:Glycosyl hydrolase n=1 Tax=Enterococcus caccae ATCC BAA-1240 TaxID=1158612 RepID=R3X9I5_9ENTE|nr:glycosyl hydrolase family 65 protein [Enterococcus caccae]EOL50750.1 glycosyl hydrolase [Enterococcus caccae ATCC BAA-1240]EOT59357.1 glycosyl hydrolase [Enterococcus caccae ATCC BAA-1240]OJG27736.1 glycosyl hydrolase [Enterococcus caccae]